MIGERIRQARLVACLTLGEVAARLEGLGETLSRQALSNYENGKRTPRPKVLMRLAKALAVKPKYFLDEPKVTIQWGAYRCQAALREREKGAIKALAQSVAERQMYLQAILFPGQKPEFPNLRAVTTGEQAEGAAAELRAVWRLGDGPIESLTQTIESHGGLVVAYCANGVRFDGLCGWVNGAFPLVVVNSNIPDDRRRLDLGHELGHLMMDASDVSADREEALAYRFAGGLLAPADTVREELGMQRRRVTLRELALLKQKYGLSMQAWLYRLCDLEIIRKNTRDVALRAFAVKKWKKHEPVDFHGDEQSTRLQQMTLRALAEGIITEERAEEFSPGCTKDVDELLGPEPRPFVSARELMRLPRSRRQGILAKAAALAEEEYRENRELTDFEAFGEDDLHD